MNRRSLVLLAALAAASGGACGGGGASSGGAAPRFLSLGTAPPGGAFYVVGGALAEVLTAADPSIRVTAEATKGTQENIRRLAAGELDLALANSAITYFAVRGEEGWERAYPMSAVMTLAPNVGLFVAKQNGGPRTLEELRGRRVVVGPAGAGFEFFLRPILAAHGLSFEDFTALPGGTQASAVDLLTDGTADAVFLGGAIPTAAITQAASSLDLVFIPYDETAMEQIADRYPFFQRATIPAGTYRGLGRDYEGLDVGSMHLIAATAAPEELIYRVTKDLYENRQRVVEKHPAGRAIQPQNVVRDTGIEFHPGAVRYYREIGLWPEP
jgi:hypothetical protein